MALWVCKEDGVKYAVDAPACPQCGSTDHYEDGAAPPAEPAPIVDDEAEGQGDGDEGDKKKTAGRSGAKGAK